MGIFSRLGEIINANINTMLDKAEDPEKMIRLMIHEMEDTLTEIKSSAAEVIADRIRTERTLKRLKAHVQEWQEKAELAVTKNRDDLARIAIERRMTYETQAEAANQNMARADEMVQQYQTDIARLEEKLKGARQRQRELLLKHRRAQNSRRVEEGIYKADREAFHKFEMYAQRIDQMEADTEVGKTGEQDLERAFHELEHSADVDQELEKLKKRQ